MNLHAELARRKFPLSMPKNFWRNMLNMLPLPPKRTLYHSYNVQDRSRF